MEFYALYLSFFYHMATKIRDLTMKQGSTTYVFVYGTLRPPQSNTTVADTLFFSEIAHLVFRHEPAVLSNAILYNIGTYPAVDKVDKVDSAALIATQIEQNVYGDLLEVDATALAITDRIEDHPHLYTRQLVEVQTKSGMVEAWVYWASKALIANKPRIDNGDWFKRFSVPDASAEIIVPDQSTVDPLLAGHVKRFAESDCSWLATVRTDGRAHCAPMWHVWYRGRIYLVAQATSIKMKNIDHNPSVTITHPDPSNVIIIDGWAIETTIMADAIQPLMLAKYEWDISTDNDYQKVIEITPLKLMTWNNGPTKRWQSDEILNVW